jgi:uncharacterized damage-inducible protein DinB
VKRIKWVDRRFSFDFPVEIYPELLERLRGTPARVADRLSSVEPAAAARRRGASWSMQEHAGHLADMDEGLFLARIEEYLLSVATLRAADMSNRATEAARHNDRPLAEVLARLSATRGRLMLRVESLAPEDFTRTAYHPRLGRPMRLVDMLYFHAEHDDYHIASITDLLRAR